MSFSTDIAKYANKVGLEVDDAVVAVCTEVSNEVIRNTPVASGRLRGNWYATIDTISDKTSDTRREAQAIADANSKAMSASGKVFNLTNNLPYAYRIEYLGWSNKAPAGFLRISVAKVENSLRSFR